MLSLQLKKTPDQICLRVGTNDLKSSTPNDVSDAIIDLAGEVEDASESEIALSELTARNDDYSDAVKEVNKRLIQFCQQNNWKLISHANISSKGLNKGGLHLNREGNEFFQKNFVNFWRSNWFPNSMNADNSLISLTLPESVENELHAASSSLSNAPSFLSAKRGFRQNGLFEHLQSRQTCWRVLLSEFSVDILAINETKHGESIKSSELHISGYDFIRRDRSRNGRGAGFYIKTYNSYVVRSDLNVIYRENLIIEIREPNSKPFLIATWWTPPCSPPDLFLSYESFIDKLDSLGLENICWVTYTVIRPLLHLIQILVIYSRFRIYMGSNN